MYPAAPPVTPIRLTPADVIEQMEMMKNPNFLEVFEMEMEKRKKGDLGVISTYVKKAYTTTSSMCWVPKIGKLIYAPFFPSMCM